MIGRNTAFTYKGKAVDLKQIGRELNVRYVREGSFWRCGKRMRVNVQLIDAETGNHLWADRFDKPLADLFDMQDEIVARLAGALNAELVAAEARRARTGAADPDSTDLYFQEFGLLTTRDTPLPTIWRRRAACSIVRSQPTPKMSRRSSGSALPADQSGGQHFFSVTDRAATLTASRKKPRLTKALSAAPKPCARPYAVHGHIDHLHRNAAGRACKSEGAGTCIGAGSRISRLRACLLHWNLVVLFIGRPEETEFA